MGSPSPSPRFVDPRLLLLLLGFLITGSRTAAAAAADEADTSDVYKYRVVNWCVTGKVEPELFEWPFVQFKPFLAKTDELQNITDWKPGNPDDILYDDPNDPGKKVTVPPPTTVFTDTTLTFTWMSCDAGASGQSTKTKDGWQNRIHVHITLASEIEGLLIQSMHAPFGLGFPFGQFHTDAEFQCSDCRLCIGEIVPCISRPDTELIAPTIGIFHHQQLENATKEIGKKAEVHFSFKWHSAHSSPARHVEFWVLAVHSFSKRQFEVRKYGPYNLQSDKDTVDSAATAVKVKLPATMPSPVLPECRTTSSTSVKCHGTDYTPPKVDSSLLRMNGEFDGPCVARYKNKTAGKQCDEFTGKFKTAGKSYDELKKLDQEHIHDNRPDDNTDDRFGQNFCRPCTYLKDEDQKEDSNILDFLKRTPHGIFMISSFFLILPISIVIGRFYKETYHKKECKGWRTWMWLHFGFAICALLWSYIGYNIPTFNKLDKHMYIGYISLYSGLIALITGWFRHKESLHCSFWIHSISGYTSWISAVVSMCFTYASWYAKGAVIASICVCFLFMLILTCQIRSVDKQVGMVPKREHIPILQIRYENIIPPGETFRKVCLGLLIVLLIGAFVAAMLL